MQLTATTPHLTNAPQVDPSLNAAAKNAFLAGEDTMRLVDESGRPFAKPLEIDVAALRGRLTSASTALEDALTGAGHADDAKLISSSRTAASDSFDAITASGTDAVSATRQLLNLSSPVVTFAHDLLSAGNHYWEN